MDRSFKKVNTATGVSCHVVQVYRESVAWANQQLTMVQTKKRSARYPISDTYSPGFPIFQKGAIPSCSKYMEGI